MPGSRPEMVSARNAQSHSFYSTLLPSRNARNSRKTLNRGSHYSKLKPGLPICHVSQKPARALGPNDVIFTVCARTPSKEPTS